MTAQSGDTPSERIDRCGCVRIKGGGAKSTRIRPTTSERGYGFQHQRTRRLVEAVVRSGEARCARCGGRIAPGEPFDLGHDDHDRTRYSGAEHAAAIGRPLGGGTIPAPPVTG
jgi:hypothetical protein